MKGVSFECHPGEELLPMIRLCSILTEGRGHVRYFTSWGELIRLEVWHWPIWGRP